jgi:hypothetical protein
LIERRVCTTRFGEAPAVLMDVVFVIMLAY